MLRGVGALSAYNAAGCGARLEVALLAGRDGASSDTVQVLLRVAPVPGPQLVNVDGGIPVEVVEWDGMRSRMMSLKKLVGHSCHQRLEAQRATAFVMVLTSVAAAS